MTKKIKNISVNKKGFARRFISFLMITIIVVGIIPLAFNPRVHADTAISSAGGAGSGAADSSTISSEAQTDCNTEQDVSDCESAFEQGYTDEESGSAKSSSDISQYCRNKYASAGVASAKNGPPPGASAAEASCGDGYNMGVSASQSDGTANSTNPNGGAATVGSDTPGAATTPTCESNGDVVAWAMCAIIEGIGKAVDWIFNNLVQPLLEVAPVNIDPSSSPGSANYDPTHTLDIWSNFRDFGDAFLVIALLVVVFGESIGGGLIDAYTVKKVLPRLLVAAVLINVSIYIVAGAVDVTNILGDGMSSLIQEPFESQIGQGCNKDVPSSCQYYTLQIHGPSNGAAAAAIAGGAVLLGGAAIISHHKASGGLIDREFADAGDPDSAENLASGTTAQKQSKGFASTALEYFMVIVVLPMALLMLAILATVLIRRGLILFLIFISPIAFALYCLPNTEKHFRRWWDLFFRTLLIYPLIAIFFAMGNVLSVTISSGTGGLAGSYASLIGVIAMFAPLFMIPFSFKLAGGVLGQIHDIANRGAQMSRSAIHGNDKDPDSLKNRVRRNFAASRNEYGLNTQGTRDRIAGLATGQMIGDRKGYAARREATKAAIGTRLGKEAMESDKNMQANMQNEKYWEAMVDMDSAMKQRNETAENSSDRRLWDMSIAAAKATPKTRPNLEFAQQRLSQMGYGIPGDTREAYEAIATRISNITGAGIERYTDEDGQQKMRFTGRNAGRATALMNNSEYSLGAQGGRTDLGKPSSGAGLSADAGISKFSIGDRARSSKPTSFSGDVTAIQENLTRAAAAEARGDMAARGEALDRAATIHQELISAENSYGVTNANRKAIREQLARVDGKYTQYAKEGTSILPGVEKMIEHEDQVVNLPPGQERTTIQRIERNSDGTTATDLTGWNPADIALGQRTVRVTSVKRRELIKDSLTRGQNQSPDRADIDRIITPADDPDEH